VVKKAIFVLNIQEMKKFFGLVAFALLLNGCDDGDIEVSEIDFSEIVSEHCGNIIYKMKETETLFFEVPYETSFINDQTPTDEPITVNINGTANHRILYRAYDGDVADANVCETVQPGTPNIIEEWTVPTGYVEIATTAVKIPNTELAGGEIIQKYRHKITFRAITFVRPEGVQPQEDLEFGDYFTFPNTLPFNFDDEVTKCSNTNLVINTNGSEAITLDIDPTLIVNADTAPGVPRTGVVSTTLNKLTYRLFTSQITPDYFCNSPTPSTPALKEQWNAVNGVTNLNGIVEVTTTSSGGVYQHEIHLKNVTFKKGNSTFLLANDYFLGKLVL
jgi:hypothetical protein